MNDFYYAGPVKPFFQQPVAYNTFTTLRDITPANLPIINGGDTRPESQISIESWGNFSCTGTPTLQLGYAIETTAGAIALNLALSSAIALPSGATTLRWKMSYEGTVVGNGVSGSIIGSGVLWTALTASTWATPVPIPITDALCTVAFDTTIPRGIGLIAAFSASNVANEVKVSGHRVTLVN